MIFFLITRLPSHSKALEVIEYMQKNNFSFRLSLNSALFAPLMSSGKRDSRLAADMGLSKDFERGDEENRLINHLTNDFRVKTEDPDNYEPTENSHNTVESKKIKVEAVYDEGGDESREEEAVSASFFCQDDVCFNLCSSPADQIGKRPNFPAGPNGKAFKRKAEGVPRRQKHLEVKRRKKTGGDTKREAFTGCSGRNNEKEDVSGTKALVKEKIVEEPVEDKDRRGLDKTVFAIEHEKFRQSLLTIASSIPFPFTYEVFRKLFHFKRGGCLQRETRRFGYGSIEKLVVSIPEIHVDVDGTFSWIGKQHEISDLEEVRAMIVEVLRGFGNRAAIGAINNSYLKNYGESIPFENLGYKNLRSLLLEHPMLEEVPGRVFRLRETTVEGEKNAKEGSDRRLIAGGASGDDDVTGKKLIETEGKGVDVEKLDTNVLKMLDKGSE